MITQENIIDAILNATEVIRQCAPYRTGNLRVNGITYRGSAYQNGTITVSIDETRAPYAKYTILPWRVTSPYVWRSKNPAKNGRAISPLYNRDLTPKVNPNEGWWERAWQKAALKIAEDLGAPKLFRR